MVHAFVWLRACFAWGKRAIKRSAHVVVGAYLVGLVVVAGPNAAGIPLTEELLYQGLAHSESLFRDLSVSFVSEDVRYMSLPGDEPGQDYPVRTVRVGTFAASGRRYRIDVETTEQNTGRATYSEWLNDGEELTWLSYVGSRATALQLGITSAVVHHWPSDHKLPELILFDSRVWLSFGNEPLSSLLTPVSRREHLRIEPVDVDGDSCFRLTVLGAPDVRSAVLVVNASRGYLLQHRSIEFPNRMKTTVDIELHTQDSVVWHPKTVRERIYQRGEGQDEGQLVVDRRVEFSDFVSRPNLPSARFTVSPEVLSRLRPDSVRDHR